MYYAHVEDGEVGSVLVKEVEVVARSEWRWTNGGGGDGGGGGGSGGR